MGPCFSQMADWYGPTPFIHSADIYTIHGCELVKDAEFDLGGVYEITSCLKENDETELLAEKVAGKYYAEHSQEKCVWRLKALRNLKRLRG